MFGAVAGVWRRRRWINELLVLGGLYLTYELVRGTNNAGAAKAFGNGIRLLNLETLVHLDPEHALNTVFEATPALAVPAVFFYATAHYVVTLAVLIWLWRAHPRHYRRLRTVLVVATLIGLVGFWVMPTAPPRMLGGFVDTMAQWSQIGWWGGAASAPDGLQHLTDQYGAMPSLHVGWALWCGWAIARHARHRATKVIGVLYPITTAVVVIGTANHYLADAIAGAFVMSLAAALVIAFRVLWARHAATLLVRYAHEGSSRRAVPTP